MMVNMVIINGIHTLDLDTWIMGWADHPSTYPTPEGRGHIQYVVEVYSTGESPVERGTVDPQ